MDVITLDNLLMNRMPTELKMNEDGIAIKNSGEVITITKDNIKNIDFFRSLKQYCLRIQTTDTQAILDLYNFNETYINTFRNHFSQLFGITASISELEVNNTTYGNLNFTNNMVELRNEKLIFSIPRTEIKHVIELNNDVEIYTGDVDIVFNTTSGISHFLSSKVAEEKCIIPGVNCIYPRSKSTLVFLSDYFVLKGSSYDHTIFYHKINEMMFLKKDIEYYLVLKLDAPIIQGQTKYESIVFLLQNKEVEVATKDNRLKPFYQGLLPTILLEIFESLLQMKAQESEHYIKCTSKVFEGFLYLLKDGLQFLPKAISINLDEISHVEFSRINLSMAQAKTFDMTIYSDKVYSFTGIRKESFNDLEVYFNKNEVKIVSEVIEESFSSGSSEEDSDESDLSDIIDSGDD